MGNTKYIISRIDNKEYCIKNGQFTRHLRANQLTYQEYYEKYITGVSPKCSCGKALAFYQNDHSYAQSCGKPLCRGKSISTTKQNWTPAQKQIDSENKSFALKHETPEQKANRKIKIIRTNQERYGVNFSTQSPGMKEKSKETKKLRYGDSNYSNPEETSKSWKSKSVDEINKIVEKRKSTCLERFGVENALLKPISTQNAARSNSLGKEFKLPSGKIIHIRGYEDRVLKILLESFTEDELIVDDRYTTSRIPVVQYSTKEGRRRKYHPDIYIPTENKIIEVKSRWWWDANGRSGYENRISNNLSKRDAALSAGYQYEVWLFETKTKYRILTNDADFN